MAARAEHQGDEVADLNSVIADRLSGLAVEELQCILEGVCQDHLAAPREEVLHELGSFRRIRELPPEVVDHLAAGIAAGERPLLRRGTHL